MTKKEMLTHCELYNITFPEGATKKQLESIISDYYKNTAVVTTNNGWLCLLQTDKPTDMYTVEFTLHGEYRIRAESEEAAHMWVEENALDRFGPVCYQDAEIIDGEVIDCYKDEEAV